MKRGANILGKPAPKNQVLEMRLVEGQARALGLDDQVERSGLAKVGN